jgi:hypothetical protein
LIPLGEDLMSETSTLIGYQGKTIDRDPFVQGVGQR